MKKIKILINLLINYTKNHLQDNVIDKKEYASLCNICTKYFDENKKDFFYMNIKKIKVS